MTDSFGEYSPHSWRLRLTVSLMLFLILTWGSLTMVGYDSMQQLAGLSEINSLLIPAQQRFLGVSLFSFSVNIVLIYVLIQRSLLLERIFDPLYRVDSSRSRTTGGFGLGLPYVKRSLESCGGSIEVISSVGVGSCFIVKLPLAGVRR